MFIQPLTEAIVSKPYLNFVTNTKFRHKQLFKSEHFSFRFLFYIIVAGMLNGCKSYYFITCT